MRSWQHAAMNQQKDTPLPNPVAPSLPPPPVSTVIIPGPAGLERPKTVPSNPTAILRARITELENTVSELRTKISDTEQRIADIETKLIQTEKAPWSPPPEVPLVGIKTKDQSIAESIAHLISIGVFKPEDTGAIEARKEILSREYDELLANQCKS